MLANAIFSDSKEIPISHPAFPQLDEREVKACAGLSRCRSRGGHTIPLSPLL